MVSSWHWYSIGKWVEPSVSTLLCRVLKDGCVLDGSGYESRLHVNTICQAPQGASERQRGIRLQILVSVIGLVAYDRRFTLGENAPLALQASGYQ